MGSDVETKTGAEEARPVLPYKTPVNPVLPLRERRYHAGTLTYTFGGLVVLFFWLLWGDFTISLKDRSVTPTFQVLLRTHEASAFVMGLLLSFLPPLIVIFLIPVISFKSDRHRGKWGRRIPFLLIPTPLAVLTMVGLGYSPMIGRWIWNLMGGASSGIRENTCILICIGAGWTLFEFANITCGAVFSWLINDVVPRPMFGRFYGMFRALSLIAGMVFMKTLYGTVKTHYLIVFISLGALYGVSFTAMCLMVKEGEPPPLDESREKGRGAFTNIRNGIGTYVRDCFTNPYYLWFFLSFALAHAAFTPINNYSIPFSTSLGMSDERYGYFSFVQFGVSLALSIPIGLLADKIHPIRATLIALGLYAVVTLVAFFFVRSARAFAAAHVICGACSGIWLTASAPLGPRLLPKSKFASYVSALGIFTSIGTMIVGPLVGALLDWLNLGRKIEQYDFHYMYLWASIFITLSLVVTLVVYRRFLAYGGTHGYVAPE
jgi:maltose/moltooligosaccharide transporter